MGGGGCRDSRGGSTYGPNWHRPPFWQINHANSAYFRLFLGYFGVISATQPPPLLDLGPPFLHILDPPLDSVLYFNSHLALWVSRQTCQLLKAFPLPPQRIYFNLIKQKIQVLLESDSTLVDFNHPLIHPHDMYEDDRTYICTQSMGCSKLLAE